MKSRKQGFGYNERLFSGGIRSHLHLARFHWFVDAVNRLGCPTDSVLELGCFDGKLLDFIKTRPSRYVGFDANWEGGLDKGRARWADRAGYSFFKVTAPEEIQLADSDVFQLAVAMETLKHVEPAMVDGYLRVIAAHLDGYLFVTVPNEMGPVFLLKWLAKRFLNGDAHEFSFAELVNSAFYRSSRVRRNQHKGFDYRCLLAEIGRYFTVLEVSGHPLGFMPPSLCFGVGIIARSKA